MSAPRPWTLIAELTYACPLRCAYCSNPVTRPQAREPLTTPEWQRLLAEAEGLHMGAHLTSRLDEAGDLLSGLVGMNLDQFCQVALLPQGHFQAFLRATPDQRQRLQFCQDRAGLLLAPGLRITGQYGRRKAARQQYGGGGP